MQLAWLSNVRRMYSFFSDESTARTWDCFWCFRCKKRLNYTGNIIWNEINHIEELIDQYSEVVLCTVDFYKNNTVRVLDWLIEQLHINMATFTLRHAIRLRMEFHGLRHHVNCTLQFYYFEFFYGFWSFAIYDGLKKRSRLFVSPATCDLQPGWPRWWKEQKTDCRNGGHHLACFRRQFSIYPLHDIASARSEADELDGHARCDHWWIIRNRVSACGEISTIIRPWTLGDWPADYLLLVVCSLIDWLNWSVYILANPWIDWLIDRSIDWLIWFFSGSRFAVAKEAYQRGARVTIIARKQAQLNEAREAIESLDRRFSSQKVHAISLDITQADQVPAALQEAVQQNGPIDVLINCAGTSTSATFEDTPIAEFHRLMEINYFGSVNTTKAVVTDMKARKSGRIVFVSSQVFFLFTRVHKKDLILRFVLSEQVV